MTFLSRDVLYLLLTIPGLMLTYVVLMRRKKPALHYSSLTLLRDAVVRSHRIRPHVPPFLFLIAFLALLVASARPVAVITLPSEQRTIVLAIDISLSMGATDVTPNRLEAAKAAAKAFIQAQPRDVRVGIVAFAGSADLVQAPTTNRADALAALEQLALQYNTAIGSGVLAALLTIFPNTMLANDYDIFGFGRSPVLPQPVFRNQSRKPQIVEVSAVPAGSYKSAAVILLTDGRDNMGFPAIRAAQMAADRGVRVFTVGFGSATSATIAVDGESLDASFDEGTLKQIASSTRGQYFHASTAEELQNVYQTLTGRAVLEKKERELTALFTGLAALLSLTAAGLSLTWVSRLT
ncbi:MAG: transporter ATP-binding protein [Betaproteobacteria bacterium]|nr:transporter ATP-binding protein [Betaproteobacteria bacterium]